MATITTWRAIHADRNSTVIIESDPATPADDVEVSDLPVQFPHTFIGVQMFDSAGARIVGTSGTFTITAQAVVTRQDESLDDGPTIDATAPTTSSVGVNLHSVKAVTTVAPDGNDMTTWKLVLTMNKA